MRDFRNLEIWKKSVGFTIIIYRLTDPFPDKEKFGLTSQLRRASVSMASNIAEGASRNSETDFARYLEISMGSAFEIETQLIVSREIGYITFEEYNSALESLSVIQKQINQLISKIRNN
ncbi:MAG: four helix bundle protein [Saprospiraceae bacterium]|nr:four helix bundle protein [Saprospiraceae bacterium]